MSVNGDASSNQKIEMLYRFSYTFNTGMSRSTCCNNCLKISGMHGLRLQGQVLLEDHRSKGCCILAGNCSAVYRGLLHLELQDCRSDNSSDSRAACSWGMCLEIVEFLSVDRC